VSAPATEPTRTSEQRRIARERALLEATEEAERRGACAHCARTDVKAGRAVRPVRHDPCPKLPS
jgi:hypothetical protein